ncbi:MAG TPA: hypothetical protein VF258_07910 [Luteolibacter sp.]
MKTRLATITTAFIASTFSMAAEPPAEAKASSAALISALEANDHAAFQAKGDEKFAKALTKELFGRVQTQLGPRLKAGYELVYLTELNRQGHKVTLWKLTFKDGGDDALATLSMKDGKVTGFFIQ